MPCSIAVIMPVRNGLQFLHGAIDCVEAQNYPSAELVIVDDASTDGSGKKARQRGVRVIETPGVGPSAARNAGIQASSSKLLAFLDVDDLWPVGTLNRLAAALDANPRAGMAQGMIQNFRDLPDGTRRVFTDPYRFLNIGASLYCRRLFETIGGFDEGLTFCEDFDFLMRCWERDIVKAEIPEVTLLYRRHPDSMTSKLEKPVRGTVPAFQRRLDRIRRGAFNPNEQRVFASAQYIGIGPRSQDDEALL